MDNKTVIANKGRFNDKDLIKIWKEDKYKAKRSELLCLMKNSKFEICFELSNGDYLAPQLLPVDEVPYNLDNPLSHNESTIHSSDEDIELPNSTRQLHFEYRYQFMPKGILTRFIVKRHKDIFKETFWRYGVVLEYNNTKAIVRERYFDRKITIILVGENKKEFLSIIRKSIEEINNSYNNLDVKEMIPCNCSECKYSKTPHFYKHELLKKYEQKGKTHIDCENSLDKVSVFSILGNSVIFVDGEKISTTYNFNEKVNIHSSALGNSNKVTKN